MNYRENRIHSSQIKPYSYYQCIIPDQFAYAPMHWHSEFEINFVRTGSAEFTCGEQKFRSADGDIIVIPPNVMHSVYPCPEMHQIYDTLVFSPELFGSSESDRCIQECVKPLTDTDAHHTKASLLYGDGIDCRNGLCLCQRGHTTAGHASAW